MNFEDFKIALVETFVETKPEVPPTIDEEFISDYKIKLFNHIISHCRNAIEKGKDDVLIVENSYLIRGIQTQFTSMIFKKMFPKILEWLNEYNIPYTITEPGLFQEQPAIAISVQDLRRISNVDNLGALK